MKKLKVDKSKIAGKGLFTTDVFKKGEMIGLAHENDQPTTSIGKNHNHSDNPNAVSIKLGNKRYLMAKRPLKKGEEITTNYRLQPELEQPEDFAKGGLVKMPKPSKQGLASKKFSKSLEATNKLFTENYLFSKAKSKKRKVFDPNAKYQEGGLMTQEEIDGATEGMMKARLAYAQMHGNPAAQRMVVAPDQPYVFDDGNTGTHFMASMDNYAVPLIQDVNGQLMLDDFGPESAEAIRFDNPEDAMYFAENYKQITPDESYRKENPEEDYIEAELTEEEIEEYRKGGFIVEEIDAYQKGGESKRRKKDSKGKYRSEDGNVRTPLTPEMQAEMSPDEWGQYVQEVPEVYTTRTREQQDIRNALDYQQRMAELYPGRPTQSDAIQPADWFWQLGMLGPAGGISKSAVQAAEAVGSRALPYITGALETSIPGMASIPGATVGNALGAMAAVDSGRRLLDVPSQVQKGEYADAAANVLTGALDIGTAGIISPLYKGAKATATELKAALEAKNPANFKIPEQSYKKKLYDLRDKGTGSYKLVEIDVPQEVIPGRSYDDVKHKLKNLRSDLNISPTEHYLSRIFGRSPIGMSRDRIIADPRDGRLFDSNTRYWLNRLYGNTPSGPEVVSENLLAKDYGKLYKEGLSFEEAQDIMKKYNDPIDYQEVPRELPGSPNALKSSLGSIDMSKYEIKNPDYFTKLLDTYDSRKLSPTNKNFYKGLIESVKKQNGIATERQYNELQRLRTGNFNFGKKGYSDGGIIMELSDAEIKEYKKGGWIIEEM